VRRVIVLLSIVLALGVLPAAAQDASRLAMAEELMKAMNLSKQFDQIMDMAQQIGLAQIDQMKKSAGMAGELPKETELKNKMFGLVREMLAYDKIKDKFAAIYAETFTEEEMKGIIVFYQSPAGQSLLAKQPELVKKSTEMSMKMMQEIMPKLMQIIKETVDDRNRPQK
jgi:uncharacterized protein